MISGFGSTGGLNKHHSFNNNHTMLSLPMPFNIPKVLHNFIFEELDLNFSLKQKDLHEL